MTPISILAEEAEEVKENEVEAEKTEEGYLLSEDQLVELVNNSIELEDTKKEKDKLEEIVKSQDKEIELLEEKIEVLERENKDLRKIKEQQEKVIDKQEESIEIKDEKIDSLEDNIKDLRGTPIEKIIKNIGVFSTGAVVGLGISFVSF